MSAPSQSALQAETEARLQFEMLLADVCAEFVNVAPNDVDSKIENAQRVICESLSVDHSSVWQVSEENPDLLVMTHVYRDPNLKPLPLRPTAKEYFSWGYTKILNKEIVCVSNTATLPPEAAKDKESWEQYGIHSSLAFPLSIGGLVIGVLAFDNMEVHDWPEPLQRRLQILAHVFAQALERKHVEQKVRESENRFRLVADTAPVLIWMAGADKLCTYFNKPWLDFTGRSLERELGNGWAEGVHPEDFQRCLDTYTQSFDRREKFRMEYRLRHHDGEYRWILDIGVPRFGQDGSFVGYIGTGVDVTERKRSEERLREYEKAVEGAEEMIAVVDREYRYLIANRTFLNLRNMKKEQVVARLVPEVLNEGAFEAIVKKKLDECFTGKVVKYEMKYTYPELGERDLFISYFPIEGASGVDRVACILQDITERKRVEEALQKSEEKFSKAFRESPMALTLTSAIDHRYLDVNETFEGMTGWGRDEVIGRTPFDFGIWIDSNRRLEFEKRVLAEGAIRDWDVHFRSKDGSQRVGLGAGELIQIGNEPCILAVIADITERKQTEQALRESEEKLRLLLDSTAEAIYGVDLEHRCTFCNPACLRILGYERIEDVLGKNMHELIHHSRANGTFFPVEECQVHRVTRTGEGVHAEDEVFWRADGTSFPTEYWSYPQRRGNEVHGAVVAFNDITERKLAETALANLSRRLIEAQEQERTRIGRELHDDIGQRLALLAVELQQLHEHPRILPEVQSRISKLREQTSEIAADVQSLSHRLHSAKLQYLGLTAAMRGFCRELSEQQKVEIDFQTHDLPSPLSPDISLCLYRVLQEALHNSAKHSGVRHFEVRLWVESEGIHLTVKDSGVGFDREEGKASRGLGLISMEERLKLAKGTLSIESQLKRGTTIHACVPLGSGIDSLRAAG